MTTPIYNYTWKANFNIQAWALYNSTDDDVKNGIKDGLKQQIIEKLTEKITGIQKWLKVNDIVFGFSYFRNDPIVDPNIQNNYVEAKGTITVTFSSDATPTQEFSPQGWAEIIGLILGAIITFAFAHPIIFGVITTLILLTILTIALTFFIKAGGIGGLIFGPGEDPLKNIGTFIIVIVIILALAGLLPTILTMLKGSRGEKK